MAKELTDRVKQEIVERQIGFLKVNYPNELVNYDKIGEYLKESLEGYSLKNGEVNEKVDLELLKNLENGNQNIISRMFNAAMDVNNSLVKKGLVWDRTIIYREDVKDMHLIRLYKYNKEEGREVRNYGKGTAQLLEAYLTKKGLIKNKK